MNQINQIGQLNGANLAGKVSGKGKTKSGQQTSFKDTLGTFMKDVNSMQLKANESIEKLASGEINDVHQVMNTVAEADVAFNMMMEIRNKVMDAYQEVMRMRL